MARVVGLHPLPLAILGPHHAFVGTEHVTIVGRPFQEEFLIGFLSQHLGQFGYAPVGVTVHRRDGDCLPAFPVGVHLCHRFLFARLQGGIVAVLVVERVNGCGRTHIPGQQAALQSVFAETLVGRGQVKAQALDPGIGHPHGSKIACHGGPLARGDGKARHGTALAVHLDIRIYLVHFHTRIQNGMKRFQGNMGVPYPVVHVEGFVSLVYLAVPGTEVAAVLVDVDHAFGTAVKGGIERAFLRLAASGHLYLAQTVFPHALGLGLDAVEVEARYLPVHVSLGLFGTDIGNTVAHLHHRRFVIDGKHHVAAVLALVGGLTHAGVKLGVEIGCHFLRFPRAKHGCTLHHTVTVGRVRTFLGQAAEAHDVLPCRVEGQPHNAALLRGSKLKRYAFKLRTVIIRMRLLVVAHTGHRPHGLTLDSGKGHEPENPVAAVVGHLQREVLYPVVEHIVAQRHETQHFVGQMHRLARGFEQNTHPADSGVGIVGQRLLLRTLRRRFVFSRRRFKILRRRFCVLKSRLCRTGYSPIGRRCPNRQTHRQRQSQKPESYRQ